MTAWGRPKRVSRRPKGPPVTELSADAGSAPSAAKRPASKTRGASQGAEPPREVEEEVAEPTLQEVLGDRFIVVPVNAARALSQVWGASPAIDEYAGTAEGVWWPSGVWTSRRRPADGQTPPRTRRIISRPARDILAVTASYDTQEDGDHTWVLAMDADGDPVGVWCLAHAAAEKFLPSFTAPRWTAQEPEDASAEEPSGPPAGPESAASTSPEPDWDEGFPPEPDFDW